MNASATTLGHVLRRMDGLGTLRAGVFASRLFVVDYHVHPGRDRFECHPTG